jgi:hypothetical protein
MLGLEHWLIQRCYPLDLEKTPRIVIPGGTCFTLGFLVVRSGYFLSVLELARK